jgi:hypothetical protein
MSRLAGGVSDLSLVRGLPSARCFSGKLTVRHPGIMPGTRQISAGKPHLRPLSTGIRHRFANALAAINPAVLLGFGVRFNTQPPVFGAGKIFCA